MISGIDLYNKLCNVQTINLWLLKGRTEMAQDDNIELDQYVSAGVIPLPYPVTFGSVQRHFGLL